MTDMNSDQHLHNEPESPIDDQLFEVQSKGRQKSFMCKIPDCGKVFRYKSEIIRHIATHSEYRPYVCDVPSCSKSFKRRDALENHLRTHTKERPFICPNEGCEMKFPTKASLRYHLLKHEGQKLYKCSFPGCEKTFLTLSQLKQHENSSSVHKNIKVNVHLEPYESIFLNEEPSLQKKSIAFEGAQEYLPWEAPVKCEVGDLEKPDQDLQKVLKENDNLKKKLEESQRIITLLQQRTQMDPFAYMDHFSGNDIFGAGNIQALNSDFLYGLDE